MHIMYKMYSCVLKSIIPILILKIGKFIWDHSFGWRFVDFNSDIGIWNIGMWSTVSTSTPYYVCGI